MGIDLVSVPRVADAGVSGALATLITYLLAMLCGAFMLPRVWP